MRIVIIIVMLLVALTSIIAFLTGCSTLICSPWDPRCDVNKDCSAKTDKICIAKTDSTKK